MVKNDTVFQFNIPAEINSAVSESLTEIARQGAKQMLALTLEQEIAALKDADKAFDVFIKQFSVKYPKAVECLVKDRNELLTFYDFPAEHWKSLRQLGTRSATYYPIF